MIQGTVRSLVAALGLLLASCGGGGGGGDGGGAGGGGGSSTSGLLPKAPTPGATLYADALTLRPLKAGASWAYRGKAVAYTGAATVAYLTTTTQSAVTSTGATEATTNSGNSGPDSQTVSLAGGVVATRQSVDFANTGVEQALNFVELRSPVRVDDQYTVLDRRYTDTGFDADQDGKPDTLDVAIYARVIGAQALTLPNLPALQTVRVDTVVLTRLTASSTGALSPVFRASVSAWYAAGIGLVQQTTTLPDDDDRGSATTEETLAAWDGLSTGFGAMPPVTASIPAGNAVYPGQTLPGGVGEVHAFAFADHALLFTDTPGLPSSTLASRVDLRGKVLESTLLTDLRIGSHGALAAHADGVALLQPSTGATQDYQMTRIDRQGHLVGAVRGLTLALGGTHVSSSVVRLAAAGDGTTIWLLWSRSFYDPGNGNVPGNELILRPFGLDGQPLAPETVVEPAEGGSNLNLTAADGQVLMTWTREAPTHAVRYAAASMDGGLQLRTLASGLVSSSSFVTPLRLGERGALLWASALGRGAPIAHAAGVLLDASLVPVRAQAELSDELLVGMAPFFSDGPGAAALGTRIVVTAARPNEPLWPEDASSPSIDHVSWVDTGARALSTTPVSTVRIAAAAKRQALFADRVLVFGGQYGLSTTVVWLNTGGG